MKLIIQVVRFHEHCEPLWTQNTEAHQAHRSTVATQFDRQFSEKTSPTKNAQHQGEGEEKKENLLDYHFGQNKDIFL